MESSPGAPGGFCEDDMAGAGSSVWVYGRDAPYMPCMIAVIGIGGNYSRICVVLQLSRVGKVPRGMDI